MILEAWLLQGESEVAADVASYFGGFAGGVRIVHVHSLQFCYRVPSEILLDKPTGWKDIV